MTDYCTRSLVSSMYIYLYLCIFIYIYLSRYLLRSDQAAVMHGKVDQYRSRLTELISEGTEDRARVSYLTHLINILEGKLSTVEKDPLFTSNVESPPKV